jgi:DNA uptake protein ComE-like DNA-binding protein
MFTTGDLAEVRVSAIESRTAPKYAVTETWPIEARTLLAVIATATAIAIYAVNPDSRKSGRPGFAAAPNLVLDGNSAPPQVIEALPTLGPAMVRRWVAARSERPFSSLDDARRRVRGLGPASLPQIAPYLRFEPRATTSSGEVGSHLASDTKRKSKKPAYTARKPVDSLIAAAR